MFLSKIAMSDRKNNMNSINLVVSYLETHYKFFTSSELK